MGASRAWHSRPRKRASDRASRTRLPRWGREALAIALLGCAVFIFLSLYSYRPESDPGFFRTLSPKPQEIQNLGGPAGAYVASLLKEALGMASYLLVALIAGAAIPVIRGKAWVLAPWKVPLGLVTLIWTASLFSLAGGDRPAWTRGGFLGQQVAQWLLQVFHPAGSYLVLSVLLILSVAALGQVPFLTSLQALVSLSIRLARWCLVLFSTGAHRATRAGRAVAAGILARFVTLARSLAVHFSNAYRRLEQARQRSVREPTTEPVIVNHGTDLVPGTGNTRKPVQGPAPRIVPPNHGDRQEDPGEPSTSERKVKPRPVQTSLPFPTPLPEGYRLPPLDLLDDPDPIHSVVDEEALKKSASTLEEKLRDFGIQGRVSEIHPGPIITLFEFEPASGVKVNRIVALADDLALAMKALSVRIVAPIPGKSVVGIEVPNPRRQKVTLKEILADKAFQSSRWKLPLALGKDIAGKPVTADLSRMPHLLIAGATGTGKSVNLHSMILSLLFRFTPQEVRFLMIDPKMLELTAYHGIPHLLHPVITDSRRAADVLDWAVERMEQRYQLLSEMGVRNIDGYNEKIDKGLVPGEEASDDGTVPEFEGSSEELDGAAAPEKGRLPYIVVVIDEMADLMIISGRQIEEAITRLAQMARAAGIHLLLATQRPSVDVLTGIIKANLPARISFQVSSRTDSRTILDCIGAEKLLGQGDMLFLPPGTSKVRRIHGPYVSEPEIERVVDYIKQFGRPRYEKIPFRSKKAKDEEELFEQDEKYDEAVRLVAETRQASISMIQRKLRVGYNRAARMIERMEQEGLVGPQEGVKPREVFINNLE